ncbi:hypothetical protein IF1G_05384 [Cordyceps javanica]|uniref:Uncharacterized protein n=1 Tax=Cordyceps javanica TaxID=43265 RepID=A0A545V1F0_9HYPO|nr:hypothetical protein IF1G_05384 [Cordyceps javanica]
MGSLLMPLERKLFHVWQEYDLRSQEELLSALAWLQAGAAMHSHETNTEYVLYACFQSLPKMSEMGSLLCFRHIIICSSLSIHKKQKKVRFVQSMPTPRPPLNANRQHLRYADKKKRKYCCASLNNVNKCHQNSMLRFSSCVPWIFLSLAPSFFEISGQMLYSTANRDRPVRFPRGRVCAARAQASTAAAPCIRV